MYNMYEKYLEKVMKENCKLSDWENYKLIFKKIPRISHDEVLKKHINSFEVRNYWKRCEEFATAAKHVAARLSLDDISKDVTLELAYHELFH